MPVTWWLAMNKGKVHSDLTELTGLLKLCTLMDAKSWLVDVFKHVTAESNDDDPESGCFQIAWARIALA